MRKMATINARIDDDIKKQADDVLKRLNISQTEAILLLYQYIADHGKLPFTVSTEIMTEADDTQYILKEIKYIISNCQGLSGTPLKLRHIKEVVYITDLIVKLIQFLENRISSFTEEDKSPLIKQLKTLFQLSNGMINRDVYIELNECINAITTITDRYDPAELLSPSNT